MNTYQAKRIPLSSILAKLGCEPHHTAKGELWYLSPFRNEDTASFKINLERNIWYDFGLGSGGNVLDFVMKYYGITTIGETLHKLDNLEGWVAKSPAPPKPAKITEKDLGDSLIVTKVQPLQNSALIGYLKGRGVPSEIASLYVQEMYYTYNYRRYFALAFQNRSGAWELRNPYFKGIAGSKDISVIAGTDDSQAMIFEGFMNMLSALTYYSATIPPMTTIVMNSVAMKDKTIEALKDMRVTRVHLYLDHDSSGQAVASYLREALTGVEVIDQSAIYAGFNDFNDLLQSLLHTQSKTKSGIPM